MKIVQELIEQICKKTVEYWDKYGNRPNIIVMNRSEQVLLSMHYLNMIGTDMKSIYGMRIIIDNDILDIKDIKVYYSEELEKIKRENEHNIKFYRGEKYESNK